MFSLEGAIILEFQQALDIDVDYLFVRQWQKVPITVMMPACCSLNLT